MQAVSEEALTKALEKAWKEVLPNVVAALTGTAPAPALTVSPAPALAVSPAPALAVAPAPALAVAPACKKGKRPKGKVTIEWIKRTVARRQLQMVQSGYYHLERNRVFAKNPSRSLEWKFFDGGADGDFRICGPASLVEEYQKRFEQTQESHSEEVGVPPEEKGPAPGSATAFGTPVLHEELVLAEDAEDAGVTSTDYRNYLRGPTSRRFRRLDPVVVAEIESQPLHYRSRFPQTEPRRKRQKTENWEATMDQPVLEL